MRVSGQRIIVFGDSLSKHGHDSSPEIWDVNQGSNRPSSSPGDLLASMLAEQGAQAVRVNARVSRSAWNFFQRENSAQLLAADAHFKPTRVVIMLGTNDVGLNQIQDREAFTKLRDSYLAMGAEVWAVGPFANTSLDQAGVVRVVQTMRGVFGRQFIDGREISLIVKPGRDGVHYDQIGARQLAIAIAGALAGRMATNTIWATAGFSLLGVGLAVIAAMAYRRYGGKQLGLAAGDDDDSDDDWGSDAWQAKHDAKRERETKKISAALKTSPALIASTGHREHLVIVGGDPSEPGKLRASQFADDGPLGHETRANQDEIVESIRQSYRSVRPATDEEVIAWTSSEKFVEGSKRVAFTQAANMLNWRAGQKDARDRAREIENKAHKLASEGDWENAIVELERGVKELGGASGEDVSVQDLFSDESPNAMQVAEDFILERGWKLTRGFIGGGRHYSIDMSTPSIGQRNLKRTNPEAAWAAEEVAEDRKLWKRAGASVETQPNDAGPGTYPGDQRITRTIALHAYNGNQEAVTREVKLNNVTIDEARKFAAAATWAMAKQIKPRELDTDVSDVVYETARILRAASRRKKLLQPSELFGLGRKITRADVVDAVTGLEGQTEDAISIALDMAEQGDHALADEILSKEASAVPTGLAPISQTIVAQCIRPISHTQDDQVKQALYHVQSAGPEIGRHDGSPLSREPYVIVSASKRFASKHNVGETAVFPAKADSTRVPEDTEGHAVFPIVLVPRPIPDAVDDPDEEMAFVPRADFRYMFSHVEALRELAVTHIVPCEGVELFGLEGATNIVDGKRSNESEAAIIRSGARQVACKSGLDLKKLATCWTRKGALGKPQSMLKTIAAESQSADEFARRAEAWASAESNPPSDKAIAKLFKGASVAMIEQAREARQASTQARYKKLARGLRGDDRDQIIADAIKDSAERAGTWKGSRKVFVSDAFKQLRKDGRDDGFTLEEFKHELVRLHKAGKIKLARADLVAAMPANKVAQSEIDARGATFNFVQLDGLLGATVGETFKRNNSKTAYTVVEIVRPARSVGTLKIGETIRISHGDELIDVTDAGGTWLDDQGRKYKRTK